MTSPRRKTPTTTSASTRAKCKGIAIVPPDAVPTDVPLAADHTGSITLLLTPQEATARRAALNGITIIPVPLVPSVLVFPLDVSKPGVQRLLRAVAFVQRELDQQRVAAPVNRAS